MILPFLFLLILTVHTYRDDYLSAHSFIHSFIHTLCCTNNSPTTGNESVELLRLQIKMQHRVAHIVFFLYILKGGGGIRSSSSSSRCRATATHYHVLLLLLLLLLYVF